MRSGLLLRGGLVSLVALLAGCAAKQAPVSRPAAFQSARKAAATQPSAGLPPATFAVQAPGSVAILAGPFSDRFQVTNSSLSNSSLSVDTMTARATVAGWEGELITMSTAVGFYDAAGNLLEVVRGHITPKDGQRLDHADFTVVASKASRASFALFSVVDFVTE